MGNHVVKVGKKTYKHPENGKNYDMVDQLTEGLKNRGRLVVMDSGFPTFKLMVDAKEQWNTRLISTQRGNTAHLPKSHKENLRSAKAFVRGYSKSLHSGSINITYWNDNNVVVFLDNDIESDRGFIRKQSRIFDSLCEMYVLVNGHTLWCNQQNLIAGKTNHTGSQSAFRFEVIRIWYALYRKTNGSADVLHYPKVRLRTNKRSLEMTLASPRKGRHEEERISASESTSRERRLKCRMCHKKTSFKCLKCSSPDDPLVLCSNKTGRNCWNEYHIAREYDLPSSQSQEDLDY